MNLRAIYRLILIYISILYFSSESRLVYSAAYWYFKINIWKWTSDIPFTYPQRNILLQFFSHILATPHSLFLRENSLDSSFSRLFLHYLISRNSCWLHFQIYLESGHSLLPLLSLPWSKPTLSLSWNTELTSSFVPLLLFLSTFNLFSIQQPKWSFVQNHTMVSYPTQSSS